MARKFDTPGEARSWLADSLDLLDDFARAYHDQEAIDAVLHCRAVLRAPGELDTVALAPAIRNVHLAASRVFRRAAADAPDDVSQAMREQASHAEKEAQVFSDLIAARRRRSEVN
jgi:hypothetical protein